MKLPVDWGVNEMVATPLAFVVALPMLEPLIAKSILNPDAGVPSGYVATAVMVTD